MNAAPPLAHERAEPIAIVGMAGRFPGAADVATFWRRLKAGDDLITRFTPDVLEDDPAQRVGNGYVPARAVIDGIEAFDAEFFGMYPREAAITDPQARLLMEVAWEALEDAGLVPARFGGAVGIFAGCSLSTYFLHHILQDRATLENCTTHYHTLEAPTLLGAITDTLATRIAYKLDLRGPALTVHTACSTSLTAVALACESLASGASDAALAGGVSVTFPQYRGYVAQSGGMVSTDGVCRPFDAAANGTVFGHGAGIVVLKRLADAIAAGDRVHAVIRGCGINNDGSDKVAFTAPSVGGQAEAIALAHVRAGIDPADIGYIECHGTATPLGDPIEFRGLLDAFGETGTIGRCALGSAKANVGHLDAASGVTGLIKCALAVSEGAIPPMAHFERANPAIDLDASPFFVPTTLQPFPERAGPRLAGVSSFGVGGTNVHVVVEAAPVGEATDRTDDGRAAILPLSARSADQVDTMRAALAERLADPAVSLTDIAHTLACGRTTFPVRFAAAARTRDAAIAALRDPAQTPRKAADATRVVFLFPGQGSQYPGMGSGLYRSEPVYREAIEAGLAVLDTETATALRALLDADPADDEAAQSLAATHHAQPALFLTSYALGKLWLSRGIVPSAMAGHSVGEFAAAALSGILPFETALRLVAARGRLMSKVERGAMLSVRAPMERIEPFLTDHVDVAARNATDLVVLAGPFDAIEAMEAALTTADIAAKRLQTSHAFHSAMMDEVVGAMLAEADGITYAAPQIPMVSSVHGRWIDAADPWCAPYVADHCRATVAFADAVETLAEGAPPIFLEVGAGRTLLTFASRALGRERASGFVASLPGPARESDDATAFAAALGQLWSLGAGIETTGLAPQNGGRIVSLPTYPFARKRHWIDPPPHASGRPAAPTPPTMATETPPVAAFSSSESQAAPLPMDQPMTLASSTADALLAAIRNRLVAILEDLSGEPLEEENANASFLELGFDSLFLGQFAQRIGRELKVDVTFRQFLAELPTIGAIAAHAAPLVPAEIAARLAPPAAPSPADPATQTVAAVAMAVTAAPTSAIPAALPAETRPLPAAVGSGVEAVLLAQLQTMQTLFHEQLSTLGVAPTAPAGSSARASSGLPHPADAPSSRQIATAPHTPDAIATAEEVASAEPVNPRFALARITSRQTSERSPSQDRFLQDLIARYASRHAGSKAYTGRHRQTLADPRAAGGFRAEWKEMTFPIIAERSKGARIWDVDGNEFVDLVNGFGQTAFGHAPDFVLEALARQMEKGFAIGPQAELAGPIAARIAAITGMDRVTFCNTGSEAVMAAMRVARAITGREKVVVFQNDYHGQFDEVLVKGRRDNGALPIAPGIPKSSVGNIVVLAYGDPASLDFIRNAADDIAAVVIEPVQSRHPELRPAEFVRELRTLADHAGWALVFDEVVTGFRVARGGMQELWGIRGDLATYGKVVGGGMPIGILAGSSRFMDALDGGNWSYGDQSMPETPPTFFAGTFVRHPLVLAAVDAVLDHIETSGAALYDGTIARTKSLVETINRDLAARDVPVKAETFASWFIIDFGSKHPLGSLVYPTIRMRGVHVQEGYPCFLTTTHGDAECALVAEAFREAIDEVRAAGIFASEGAAPIAPKAATEQPVALATPEPEPVPGDIPLTEVQTEVWLAAQMGNEASCAFNESASITFDGPLDAEALHGALDALIARHDALRLVFARNGETFRVAEPGPMPFEAVDLSALANPEADLADLLHEDAETAFDLTVAPVRAMLITLAPERHVLVLTAHHIVCDGWSTTILIEDLCALYAARIEGREAALPPAPSFARYALGRAAAGPDAHRAEEEYWRGTFATVPSLPEMPQDRPRPAVRNFAGATTTAFIDRDLYRAIKKAGARQGATLFTTLFATLQALVGRLSGESDVVLGCPTAGQTLLDDQRLVGHCVNFLPIRAPFTFETTLADHLKAAQDKILGAFEHQDFTYGTLVRALGIERNVNRLPLTELQFNLERVASINDLPGLAVHVAPNPKSRSNFDAFFNVIESADGLRIDVDFNTEIFDRETIERRLGHYRTLLAAFAEDAARPIADMPILSAGDLTAILDVPNRTEAKVDRTANALDLILAEIARTPDAVAAEHRGERLTYAELGTRIDALAGALGDALGEREGPVAVALERSLDMLVALLAVWRSGRAYVPLDPRHPPARLAAILEEAAPVALIADREEITALAGDIAIVRPDAAGDAITASRAAPSDPAYVIFTSGSTGKPKGVVVPHRAVVNFLASMAREPGITAEDTLLAVTTVSFDIAVLELMLPLTVGARVVIADTADVLDGFRLVAMIGETNATIMQATPTLWGMLLEAGLKAQPALKILAGGEPLPADLARTLCGIGREVWNMYGPTETTIWSSLERIVDGAPITIGHPIANTELHILGDGLAPVPFGVVGELWIGGDGLASGYHARPDLTEAAFQMVALPGHAPRRLYRTGDIGRRLADGRVQLLGRRDNQVKLRGFRIELGDVETAMRGMEGVAAAAADVRTNAAGNRQLVGYYVAADGADIAPAGLAAHVAGMVPQYMVPTAWVALDALPQTGNGKLDRKALPDPSSGSVETERTYVAPATPLEATLAEIWSEVLGIHPIGTTDNLFSLGADSLNVFRISARMLDRNLGLEARHLIQHPTIKELAAFAETGAHTSTAPSLKAFRGGQRRKEAAVA
ncbi:amino acid adenylation domain-containing protein [Acuticoccus sp. M5D2P5]|uniref:non-ribosomal peptide synthetase/type I polyketide synthase n=1 Tax=Acuticoccus kalidii TaxID=2910977 RepID=UPI001F1E896D|nr:non-ribosomal peptide synthetase/type I polyketide synthase [Acuticoccus kalidii]MCF3935173.1 amino acid adenylation domain-containing protein [Acuticoccus kalidii]